MNWREDKTLVVLGIGTIFFSIIVLVLTWLKPNDGQTYQMFGGLLTGFAGALLLMLKGDKVPPAGSTTDTHRIEVVPQVEEVKVKKEI
jgi:drug/metabolite transporter superfamily protein YnfA